MPGGDDRLIPLAAETHKRITAPFLPKYTFATPKDRNLAGVFAVGDVYARDSLLDACENSDPLASGPLFPEPIVEHFAESGDKRFARGSHLICDLIQSAPN